MKSHSPATPAERNLPAEAPLLKKKPSTAEQPSDLSGLRLRHELQVHQIDLERQKEEIRHARDELEAEAARYTELYDFAPIGYITLDREKKITRSNLAAALLLGTERARLTGKPFVLYLAPKEQRAFAQRIALILAGGDQQSFEASLARGDRLRRDLRITAILAPTEALECRLILEDATERKETEAALQESQTRWQFALEGAGDGIWDWDVPSGAVFFSVRWKEMLGYREDEISPEFTEWTSRIHPDDLPRVMVDLQPHLDGQQPAYATEHRMRCKDGGYKWILARGLVTARDASGKPLRVVGTHSDINDSRLAIEAVRQSATNLAAAQSIAHIGNWELNLATKLITGSAETFRMLGFDPTRPLPFAELIAMTHPEDRQSMTKLQTRVLSDPAGLREDIRLIRSNGRVDWVERHTLPVVSPTGAFVGLVGTFQDITVRKQMEEKLTTSQTQFRALAARAETVREEEGRRIARTVHDELGQQLTGLKMDLKWIERGLEKLGDERTQALMDKVVSCAALMDETVETVQRIAAELRPAILDQLGLIAALHHECQRFEQRAGLKCRFIAPQAEPDLTPAIAVACYRITQEALTNITRHAAAKSVEIEFRTETDQYCLEVRDDGRGLSAAAATNQHSLGLLGIRERAFGLGGALIIKPRPDGGTQVQVNIPLASLD